MKSHISYEDLQAGTEAMDFHRQRGERRGRIIARARALLEKEGLDQVQSGGFRISDIRDPEEGLSVEIETFIDSGFWTGRPAH